MAIGRSIEVRIEWDADEQVWWARACDAGEQHSSPPSVVSGSPFGR